MNSERGTKNPVLRSEFRVLSLVILFPNRRTVWTVLFGLQRFIQTQQSVAVLVEPVEQFRRSEKLFTADIAVAVAVHFLKPDWTLLICRSVARPDEIDRCQRNCISAKTLGEIDTMNKHRNLSGKILPTDGHFILA